jgi:flagellar motility protein MotE (MotC chaperone)
MERIKNTLREEKINKLREQLKMLESQYSIKQREIDEQRNAMKTIESKIDAVKTDMAKLEKGVPLESENGLEYSRHIKRN